MIFRPLLLFIMMTSIGPSFALEWGQIEDVSFGIGSFTEHIGQVQTDVSGSRNNFDLVPLLSANLDWSFNKDFSLIPEFAITIPKSGRDSNIKKFSYFFLADAAYKIHTESSGSFFILAGMGLALKTITGDGGTQTLQNGGSTANFPLPNGSSTSRNVVIDFGVKYKSLHDYSVMGKGLAFNLANSRNRSFSVILGANWHIDLFADSRQDAAKKRRIRKEEKEWLIKNK